MTVPFELRDILTNQVRLSTGTSDKNEALKRSPELAIELKNKISDAVEQLKIETLKEKVLSIAKKLNRQNSINVNTLDKHSLIALLEELSEAGRNEKINFGTFNVKNLRLDIEKTTYLGIELIETLEKMRFVKPSNYLQRLRV